MKVELTGFKVRKGKAQRVDDWMAFLNQNMKDVLLTLDDEKMYIESIFRQRIGDQEFLYWFSIQGEGGRDVETSPHWIDQKHLEYWEECIDPDFKPIDMQPEVVMIPQKIRADMI